MMQPGRTPDGRGLSAAFAPRACAFEHEPEAICSFIWRRRAGLGARTGSVKRGAAMTEGKGNAVDYFVDRHLREGRGDRLAFADPWRHLTYRELAAEAARFASGLRRTGIERERRIVLVMLDTV